jgi:hypothetical protein
MNKQQVKKVAQLKKIEQFLIDTIKIGDLDTNNKLLEKVRETIKNIEGELNIKMKWQVKITNDFEQDGFIDFTITNSKNEIVFVGQDYKFHFHDLLKAMLDGRGEYDGYDTYIKDRHIGTTTFKNGGDE